MKIALVGTRWLGARMLGLLLEAGHSVRVVATHGHDQLAAAADAAGVSLAVLDGPRRVGADDVGEDVDMIVAAHTHAFITADALARAKRAAIGYHPSLLPRHRGIAAVEWTIRCRDPIAGGSVYHLTERIDAGLIAAQDWSLRLSGRRRCHALAARARPDRPAPAHGRRRPRRPARLRAGLAAGAARRHPGAGAEGDQRLTRRGCGRPRGGLHMSGVR